MKYQYTPITKDQPANPFCKMTKQDSHLLECQLMDILHFLCQLGSSTNPKDREFYTIIVDERNGRLFGKAGDYGWAPNTPLAALSGAVGKLRKGDLSMKQIENISEVLSAVHTVYPHKFSKVSFEAVSATEVGATPFEKLFD